MNELLQWFNENPILYSILKYLVIVTIILIFIQLIKKFFKRHIDNNTIRYKSQKSFEIIAYFFLAIITVFYFTGNIKDFTLIIGFFSAGIAFTLQELILSIAGSLFIFIVKVYSPGDRIEINGIKGDVIDIDSIYTTMMEIGQWIESDNYSGRIVKLSNAFVFKGPVYNYSKDFPFIWDQFNLPIRYGSDMELAKSIVVKIASETLSEFTKASKSQWDAVVAKYYIENAEVNPTLAITLTDNWVNFNLRYIVDYKKRRSTKHILNEKIGEAFNKTNGKIMLASTTLELIKIPDLKVNVTE